MFNGIFKPRRKALYIAEIGLNHNGSPETAREMIFRAAECGADAVKFQTMVPEKMNSVYTESLLATGREGKADRGLIDFFHKFMLPIGELYSLRKHAEDCGLVFFSSVFDEESLRILEDMDTPLYKIASSEVTNTPLIRLIAETGKPAILSTGISTEEEIAAAIESFRAQSSAEIVLMHCVSLYPLRPEHANLSRIISLRERFHLDVGFSDHTDGMDACAYAACLGARIFEKHLTLRKDFDCPDRDVSLDPGDFSAMIGRVENAVLMLGDGAIPFGEAEKGTARGARRSLFAGRHIPAGKIIDEDDLIALRPGTGIPPGRITEVAGRTARVDIKKDRMIRIEFLT